MGFFGTWFFLNRYKINPKAETTNTVVLIPIASKYKLKKNGLKKKKTNQTKTPEKSPSLWVDEVAVRGTKYLSFDLCW